MNAAWAAHSGDSPVASNPQDVDASGFSRSVTHRGALNVDTSAVEIKVHGSEGEPPLSPRSAEFRQRFGSLRVLGLEVGGLPTLHQYIVCTAVLFFFTILYGYLQELVAIVVFERKFGLLVTLLQFSGYTVFAFLQWFARSGKRTTTMPILYSISLAVLQASMQGLSNLSMRYLNYPAKVLFKSSRVIPTMLFGVLFYGKRYSRKEYLVMVVLVAGLVLFMQADASASPEFNPVGVLLVCFSLMVDAGTINLQEYVFSQFNTDEEEMIFMSYAGGSCLLLLICMATGEINQGLAFLQHKDDVTHVLLIIVVFAACGFCGVSCVTALTKRFGALTAALTTTARKAVTIMLSFVLFPKPIGLGHVVGAVLFVSGLVCKSQLKHEVAGPSSALAAAEAGDADTFNGHRKQSDDAIAIRV